MIEVVDIHKTYRLGGADVHALRGVSLRIGKGEFVAIIGPSGSGKSTLMHILGLLDTPDSGRYLLQGRDVSNLNERQLAAQRSQSIGFVFQQFNLLPRVTARENVALPLIYADAPAGIAPETLLDQLGLGDRLHHAPSELSGGQQQRVAIARALVNRPLLLMADEPTGNLDTASSRDIMHTLKALHGDGLTVIVVTHDAEIADVAQRTIIIRDGRIEQDTLRTPSVAAAATAAAAIETDRPRRRGAAGRLRELTALFRQALRSLGANKTRTLLSMLGVMIGVGAVIAVMALGAGAKQAVEERISSMGANLLVLMPSYRQSRGVSLGAGAVSRLTLDDAAAIAGQVPFVTDTSPVVRGGGQVTHGNRNWRTSVVGVSPSYAPMHDMAPVYGRFFTQQEVETRARVAVIGLTVQGELFGEQNPVGRTIRINRVSFDVIGVLPEKGASFHRDANDQILIPVTTAMRRLMGKDYIDVIEIQAAAPEHLDEVETAARALAARRHRITDNAEDAFRVFNLADLQDAISSTSNTMAILLAGIGAISLLVGGIGIMNIMLVSVTERTREIGIRKAIGARRGDILAQFLVEAVVVSALGGLIGIALGWGAAAIMNHAAGWRVAVTARTVLVAFAFSALVGIVFGLWPARKAASLEPIEALRYE